MKHTQLFEEFVNESTLYKKGDKLTIDMGDGPEQVTVLSDCSAGASKTQFITLKRPKGAPYTITLGRLNKVLVNEVVDLVHVYDADGKMFGTGELVKTKGKKSLIRWDGSREEWVDSKLVKVVESKESTNEGMSEEE
jgi:hypothetical protein